MKAKSEKNGYYIQEKVVPVQEDITYTLYRDQIDGLVEKMSEETQNMKVVKFEKEENIDPALIY